MIFPSRINSRCVGGINRLFVNLGLLTPESEISASRMPDLWKVRASNHLCSITFSEVSHAQTRR